MKFGTFLKSFFCPKRKMEETTPEISEVPENIDEAPNLEDKLYREEIIILIKEQSNLMREEKMRKKKKEDLKSLKLIRKFQENAMILAELMSFDLKKQSLCDLLNQKERNPSISATTSSTPETKAKTTNIAGKDNVRAKPGTYKSDPVRLNVIFRMADPETSSLLLKENRARTSAYQYLESLDDLDPSDKAVIVVKAATRVLDDNLLEKVKEMALYSNKPVLIKLAPYNLKNVHTEEEKIRFEDIEIPCRTIFSHVEDKEEMLKKLGEVLADLDAKSVRRNYYPL